MRVYPCLSVPRGTRQTIVIAGRSLDAEGAEPAGERHGVPVQAAPRAVEARRAVLAREVLREGARWAPELEPGHVAFRRREDHRARVVPMIRNDP